MLKSILTAAVLTGSAFTTVAVPAEAATSRCSYASHYGVGDGYHGRLSASGERFNAYGLTAAHRTLPFGTKLRVTDPTTRKSVVVRITDRGPYDYDRELDLSYGAFTALNSPSRGVIKVCIARI